MLTSHEIRLMAGILLLVLIGWTVKSCRTRPEVEPLPAANARSSNE